MAINISSFNPIALPIVGIADEGKLSEERLQETWIRQRFLSPIDWTPESKGDVSVYDKTPLKTAAVLIPLVMRENELTVLFTQRTSNLREHAGQVSFPGGRVENQDASLIETALRETREEIGITPSAIEVIGSMPQYATRTGYVITPVVGMIQAPFTLQANAYEVAEVFEVPLSFLMDATHYQRRLLVSDNPKESKMIYTIPYERFFIWGATAGMLRNVYHFLRA